MMRLTFYVLRFVLVSGVLCLTCCAFAQAPELPPHMAQPPDPPKKEPPKKKQAGEVSMFAPDYGPTQSRNETKRPPSTPSLVVMAKLRWGDTMTYDFGAGRKVTYDDWRANSSDAYNLMEYVTIKFETGTVYRNIEEDTDKVNFDPAEIPIVYITGHFDLVLNDKQRELLRKYLLKGGTLIINSCCGSPTMRKAADREIRKMFPERSLQELPPDHPIYYAYSNLKKIRYRYDEQVFDDVPHIYGVDIGPRTAIFFHRFDLSNGWAAHNQNYPGEHVHGESSREVGANMVAYALANAELGQFLGEPVPQYSGQRNPGSAFVWTQVQHADDWDPMPAGPIALLADLYANSRLNVEFARREVRLESPDLFNYPFLYYTGLYNFEFTPQQVENLREYFRRGGFLFADACQGRLRFDAAFRREMKKVFPDNALQTIPSDFPLYTSGLARIQKIKYMPMVTLIQPGLDTPTLEAIFVKNRPAVIYSKYDLSTGWTGVNAPYCQGVQTLDALSLGMNVVGYFLSH